MRQPAGPIETRELETTPKSRSPKSESHSRLGLRCVRSGPGNQQPVLRTVLMAPGAERGLGVRWRRALRPLGSRALNPLAVSVRTLGGSPQVWAGTSNNNRGPAVRLSRGSSRCRTAAYHVAWSASLTHLTLCALFRFRGVNHLPALLTLSPSRQGASG